MSNKLETEFQFASINFPKWVWNLHKGPWKKRLERRSTSCTGWGYFHAPKPLQRGDNSIFFYLDSDGMPDLRWMWADEVSGVRISHKGWYCDDCCDEKTRGIVMRLPNKRGFIAGWSMGEGMASSVDYYVFDNERDAAFGADSMAENVADREREYQAKWRAEQDEEQERIDNRFKDAMECGI